jgi:PAS domain S-box-containing protein
MEVTLRRLKAHIFKQNQVKISRGEESTMLKDLTDKIFENIIDTIREPLLVLDKDLRVVIAGRSFYDFFKVTPEETVGQVIYDIGNRQWDIPKLRELLENILPEKTSFNNYKVEHDFTTIGRRVMLLNARQIEQATDKESIILLAIEDITERERIQNLLIDSEERFRRLFETADDGILLLEKNKGKIAHTNPSATKILGFSSEECLGGGISKMLV